MIRAGRFLLRYPASRVLVVGLVMGLLAGCAGRARMEGMLVPPDGGGPGNDWDRAVVFVPRGPSGTTPAGRGHAEIRQTGLGFEPGVLMIERGTVVTFANRDSVFHNAFSLSPAARFDLDSSGPGERRTVRFDSVGVVEVFCELHPNTSVLVVVLPENRHVRPTADGSFTLPALGTGEYLVRAWHPVYGETSAKVQVPERGRIQFSLGF